MKNNKKLLSLLAIGALIAMMVAPAFAAELLIDQSTTYTHDIAIMAEHPSTSYTSMVGQVITVNGTDDISSVSFYMKRWGTTLSNGTNGNFTAGIGTVTGSAPKHLDAELALSDDVVTRFQLSTTYSWINFTFSPAVNVDAGDIAVYLQCTWDGSYDVIGWGMWSQACVYMGYNNSNPDADGEQFHYAYSDWKRASANADLMFRVYSSTGDTPAGGGSGTGSLTTTDWDVTISSFTAFIVPLIVVLLPVMLLLLITRSRDKWVILIGLTIGTAMGYYFSLVPLWVVFLIVIGLIGMAYQSVRGGG